MIQSTKLVAIFLLLTSYYASAFLPLNVAQSQLAPLGTLPRLSTCLSAAGGGEEKNNFAVIVKATIEPDRMAEFLQMIETNAEETRKEPGCVRFDVLRSQDAPNEFFFYELYENAASIDYHKKQPHYNLWADFKESGGTIESTSFKADAEFLT